MTLSLGAIAPSSSTSPAPPAAKQNLTEPSTPGPQGGLGFTTILIISCVCGGVLLISVTVGTVCACRKCQKPPEAPTTATASKPVEAVNYPPGTSQYNPASPTGYSVPVTYGTPVTYTNPHFQR